MTDWTRVHAYAEHTYVEHFPVTSFLLAGVSNYQNIIETINIGDILSMSFELNNEYDPSAIVIKKNEDVCGYVSRICQKKIVEYVPSNVKVSDKRFLAKEKIFSLRVDII